MKKKKKKRRSRDGLGRLARLVDRNGFCSFGLALDSGGCLSMVVNSDITRII
mgnify:CR=1 FL=1